LKQPLDSQVDKGSSNARFQLETFGELMGFFRPGSAPVISSVRSLSASMTHAHERGHQELCHTTTVGWYISLIAAIAPRFKSGEQQAKVEAEIARFVDSSWVTQEGYATLRQVGFCLQNDMAGQILGFVKSLPDSYAEALNLYQRLGSDSNMLALVEEMVEQRVQGKARQVLCGIGVEYVGYVAARVAMSPPIADVLSKATELPCPSVSSLIQSNSADGRLERVLQAIDSTFLREIVTSVLTALQATINATAGILDATPRSIDDTLNDLASKLALRADLSYEPSFALSASELVKRLYDIDIQEVDGRQIAFGQNTQEYAVGVVSNTHALERPAEDPLQIGWRIREFELVAAGVTPSVTTLPEVPPVPVIVCEVLPADNESLQGLIYAYSDQAMFELFFERAKRLGAIDNTLQYVGTNEAIAFPVAIGRMHPIPRAYMKRLPEIMASGRWFWLMHDAMWDKFSRKLENEPDVNASAVLLEPGDLLAGEVEKWNRHKLANATHSMVADADPLPEGLIVYTLRVPERGLNVLMAKLAVQGRIDADCDFGLSCVGDAIFRSATARLFLDQ
jgi:hypothetical protein